MMVGIAICIFITPDTIKMGAFRFMTSAGLTPGMLFAFFLIGAALRMFALFANGRFKHGSHFRAIGSGLAAFLWFHMALALVLLTETTGTLSLGIPVYFVLSFGEVVSCYRTAVENDAAGKQDRVTPRSIST